MDTYLVLMALLAVFIFLGYVFKRAFESPKPSDFKKMAEQGDPDAQFNLGQVYLKRGDYAEALKWLRMAADDGLAVAQYAVGMRYKNGQGVKKDYAEAYFWLLLSSKASSNLYALMLNKAALDLKPEEIKVTQKRVEDKLAALGKTSD